MVYRTFGSSVASAEETEDRDFNAKTRMKNAGKDNERVVFSA